MPLQDQLRELFLLDQQVRGMRSRLDSAVRRQQAQQSKLDQLRRQHTELQDQIKHGQARASALEHQSSDIDARVEKLRAQMNAVKSNKEYSALLVEVNTLKSDKAKLEDQALEHLGEVESLGERSAEVQDKAQQQEKLVELAQTDVEAARTEVGGKLDDLTAQRDAAAAQVPAEALSLFEKLLRSHDGEALAEVHEQDRRRMEYTCGGCYMSLPIERVNTVMMKPDALTTCTHCGRILYINQELKSSIGTK